MRRIQLHAFILIAFLGTALIISKSLPTVAREGRVHTNFGRIPLAFNNWEGIELKFDPQTYTLLPTCSLLLRDYYTNKESSMVELAVVYGMDLGDFHQPEFCLEGQGLRRVKDSAIRIPNGHGGKFDANVLIMLDTDGKRTAFVYWFYTRGKTGARLESVKAVELLDRLQGHKLEPSAMVRLSTSATDGDDKALARLSRFGDAVFPYLEKELWPSGK